MRFPAAVPYLVPALKLAAAAAVVGAIVAEISTGTRGGIGRLIIEYARAGHLRPGRRCTPRSSAPPRSAWSWPGWSALFDTCAMRNRPREARS